MQSWRYYIDSWGCPSKIKIEFGIYQGPAWSWNQCCSSGLKVSWRGYSEAYDQFRKYPYKNQYAEIRERTGAGGKATEKDYNAYVEKINEHKRMGTLPANDRASTIQK